MLEKMIPSDKSPRFKLCYGYFSTCMNLCKLYTPINPPTGYEVITKGSIPYQPTFCQVGIKRMVDSLLNSSSKASEIPLAPQRKSAILTYGLAVCKLWQHCLTCLISMDESLLKNRFSRPTQLTSDCHTEKYFDAMRQTSSKLKYQTNCFFHGVIALKMDLHFSFSNPDLCRLFQSRVKR